MLANRGRQTDGHSCSAELRTDKGEGQSTHNPSKIRTGILSVLPKSPSWVPSYFPYSNHAPLHLPLPECPKQPHEWRLGARGLRVHRARLVLRGL
jgi:hypothetical protein